MIDYNDVKSKFSKFAVSPYRSYQAEAIKFIHECRSPISVVQASCGFGKSLVGCCAGMLQNSFTYLVSSKQLQSQLQKDFPELRSMMGRSNYQCVYQPNRTCADCIHSPKTPCPYKNTECKYEIQKKYVLGGSYRLLNYIYALTEMNYVGRFSNNNFIIADEADLLEGLLSNFISLSVSGRIQKRLKVQPPKYKTVSSDNSIPEWKAWARYIIEKASDRLEQIGEKPKEDEIKEQQAMETVVSKANIFLKNVDDNWILESKKNFYNPKSPPTLIFRPTWLTNELSEQYFWRHAKKYVLMSATFHPKEIMGKLLGRSTADIEYFKEKEGGVPSPFPAKNRQIFLHPAGNLTYKTFNNEAPKIVNATKKLLEIHKSESGIIHTASYKLASLIMDINSDRLITHDSKNRVDIIDKFIQSTKPLVLVSPSAERGIDAVDDVCRFIIWTKCPYLSLADKLTNKRVYSGNLGNLWFKSSAAQAIVQGCGRGVRHLKDYCICYLLDKQAVDLVLNNQNLFARYWLDACDIY